MLLKLFIKYDKQRYIWFLYVRIADKIQYKLDKSEERLWGVTVICRERVLIIFSA